MGRCVWISGASRDDDAAIFAGRRCFLLARSSSSAIFDSRGCVCEQRSYALRSVAAAAAAPTAAAVNVAGASRSFVCPPFRPANSSAMTIKFYISTTSGNKEVWESNSNAETGPGPARSFGGCPGLGRCSVLC